MFSGVWLLDKTSIVSSNNPFNKAFWSALVNVSPFGVFSFFAKSFRYDSKSFLYCLITPSSLLDKVKRKEIGLQIQPVDSLKFNDTQSYADRIKTSQKDLNEKDNLYPLELNFCPNCSNCQLSFTVPAKQMFDDYLYVSSTNQTFRNHLL